MNRLAWISMAAILPLSACSQGSDPNTSDDDESEIAIVKFHPLEQFCVEYEHQGTLSGTSKNCSRKWGGESFTVENLKIGMAGITQDQKAHKIIIGKTIYNIDPDTMTGTKTDNPFYDSLSQADPETLAQSMMDALQLSDTGEDKTIAGVTCNVFSSPQVGNGCYTDDMVMLEQDVMGNRQVATKVDLNSGGDDADYRLYEEATITDGPDVEAILNQL